MQVYAVVKVDRRIRWHYTTTILRLRIGARLTRYRNCKFHNGCRTISRHADCISRYSVPPSAGLLLPLGIRNVAPTILPVSELVVGEQVRQCDSGDAKRQQDDRDTDERVAVCRRRVIVVVVVLRQQRRHLDHIYTSMIALRHLHYTQAYSTYSTRRSLYT